MARIELSDALNNSIQELKRVQGELYERLKTEVELVRQFTQDFPEIYILESEQAKKDRLRKGSATRKIPNSIVTIMLSIMILL